MIPSTHVLSFGHDLSLLQTRQQVLATRFQSSAVSNVSDLKEQISSEEIDMVVLCHTLSEEERRAALEIAECSLPSTKVLTLVSNTTTATFRSKHTLYGLVDPRELLEKVTEVLND
jgi:hypothetical protein